MRQVSRRGLVLTGPVRDARAQEGLAVPEQQVEPLAEFLRTGGAGVALWSLDHPEVPREALVGIFARVLRGLLATPG